MPLTSDNLHKYNENKFIIHACMGFWFRFAMNTSCPGNKNKLAPEQIQEEGRNGGRVERRGAWCSQIRSNFHRDVLGELAKSSLI